MSRSHSTSSSRATHTIVTFAARSARLTVAHLDPWAELEALFERLAPDTQRAHVDLIRDQLGVAPKDVRAFERTGALLALRDHAEQLANAQLEQDDRANPIIRRLATTLTTPRSCSDGASRSRAEAGICGPSRV